MKLFSLFKQELAIDLGTANTLIIQDDKVVVDEPSIVAIDRRTNETIAVGKKAMQMHEKTHDNIVTIRPLKDGVIADFQAAEAHDRGYDPYGGQSPPLLLAYEDGDLHSIRYYRSGKTRRF